MANRQLRLFKTCSKCGEEKPPTLEFFRGYNSTERGFRFSSYCCVCQKEIDRESNSRKYFRHKDKMLARIRADRKANPEKHREWDRRNTIKNKAPGSVYNKRRYAKRDKTKARLELFQWKKDNPDKIREYWRRTYQKNKSKILEKGYRWIRENPQARAAIMNRRRAREFGAGGDYTKEDVRVLLESQGRFCFYCSDALTKFHVDHFIPLARGGSNGPENLVLSCPTCNFSKASRMPWEWMPEKFNQPQSEG